MTPPLNRVARPLLLTLIASLLASVAVHAADGPTPRQWTIDGVVRQALVFAPSTAKTEPAPLVFAFHGHGGTMQAAARFGLQTAWPQAIVVYPQGLNTPGRLVDREGKLPGWQSAPGEQADRDLKFVDAMLADLEKDYRVDPDRIYATGHSNGGTFTYVLWQTRGEKFAAFAPIASALALLLRNPSAVAEEVAQVAVRPVLHIAGENDPLVKFPWQERTIEALRNINHCGPGEPWGDKCTRYPSASGADVIACIHPGKHEVPANATRLIVKFFQEYARAGANRAEPKSDRRSHP